MTSIEEFNRWLTKQEGLNLEFKEAKSNFDADHKLADNGKGSQLNEFK